MVAGTTMRLPGNDGMVIDGRNIGFSRNQTISETDWSDCDIVIEASGKMKTKALLQSYLDQGVQRVVVTAPVKEEGVLNVVMGVNQHLYDPAIHPIVTSGFLHDELPCPRC